jgi:(p)ppGpp synthase/HD superfamily hydrolase
MDVVAERGIAAHWRYKEGRLDASPEDARFDWLRRLADLKTGFPTPASSYFAEVDLYPDEIYTFSRKEVFAFPRGATPSTSPTGSIRTSVPIVSARASTAGSCR